MIKVVRQLSLLIVVIFCIGCHSNSNNSGLNSDELAIIICDCSASLVKYNEELQLLMAAKEMESLAKRMGEGDSKMIEAINCITDQLNASVENLIITELETIISEKCKRDKRMLQDIMTKLSEFKMPQ